MMLRPTESKVLFLQQLGRGLRPVQNKERLRVLDFIGNHRGFLHKPQALLKIGNTYPELSRFARHAESGELTLPSGCFVNYDLEVLDFLRGLAGTGVDAEYEAIRASQGRRPTRTELYRSGVERSRIRQAHGHWWMLVNAQEDLTSEEADCLQRHGEFFRAVETASMNKSFKMILLEAMLAHDGFRHPPGVEALSAWALEIFRHRRPLVRDIHPDHQDIDNLDLSQWRRYWEKNPINAWTGGNRNQEGQSWFRVHEGRFEPAFSVSDEEAATFHEMVQELVDYRLAEYQDRTGYYEVDHTQDEAVTPFPHTQKPIEEPDEERGPELPYFPDIPIACGHFRSGRAHDMQHVRLKAGQGRVNPGRQFIARAVGNSMDGGRNPIRDGDYLLLEWVGSDQAGSITGSTMVVERQDATGDDQYLLRVVEKTDEGRYFLRANNPAYQDLETNEEMRTLARLKKVLEPEEIENLPGERG
jgi:SOS-response transcriptional repressor LexA